MTRQIQPRLSLLVLLLVLTPYAWAAEEEAPSIFIDRVDVNVVNIEVIVTDRGGNRVTGLTRDDFEVYEDGRQVEISNFYAAMREDPLLRDLDRDRAMITGEPATAVAEKRELPEEQQLNLLVYIDHFNLHPKNRQRVLRGLEGFLEDRIIQGDRIMLVGYDRSLDVVQPFTRDRQLVMKGLQAMHKYATHAQMDDAERRQTLHFMRLTEQEENMSGSFEYLRRYVQSARADLRQSTRAIRNTVRSLAGLPGRKAVLYVSDGLPQRPGETLYQHMLDLYGMAALREGGGSGQGSGAVAAPKQQFVDPFIEAFGEDESHLFNTITREANAHQVTFFTLDARGSVGSALSADRVEFASSPGGQLTLGSMRAINLQEPLITMAEATGGTSILNTHNFGEAFTDIAADFDSFYSLGYPTPGGGDGKFHRIEVRVKRPGIRVRHRGGFVDKPQVERVADRTMSSLLLDMDKNPIHADLSFGEPTKKGRNFTLPILVRIPLREITLLSNGEMEEGRLRIFLLVKDDKGVSDLHTVPYPLTIPRDRLAMARDRDIGYTAELKVRKGRPKIAVGIWDELSGTESYVHKKALVGE